MCALQGKTNMGICSTASRSGNASGLFGFTRSWGFHMKEIKELLDADIPVRKAAIQAKIPELETKNVQLQELIQQAKEYIAAL